jgi:hypothetical protein
MIMSILGSACFATVLALVGLFITGHWLGLALGSCIGAMAWDFFETKRPSV